MPYDPLNWYWIVGGDGPHIDAPGGDFTGDASRAFSSARNAYVPATDATYVAWRDAGVATFGFDPTTRIDTEDNLAAVLLPYGITTNFADLEPPA
jgi:hypothetical protein